jgi:uncharacterized ParB-like nuclease family protein
MTRSSPPSPAPPGHEPIPADISSVGGTSFAHQPAEKDFDRARLKAFVQDALSFLRFDPPNLLPFETVRQRLGLGEKVYRGVQSIPLAQIAGSVGRTNDFTRSFLPRSDRVRERWQKVDELTHAKGMAPIQVYKVGQVYFVLDGNHRVSVVRQTGVKTINAHVWEFQIRVPLEPDDRLEDILIRQEYLEFLERTQLDRARPEIYMILTQPGRYREFEEQIAIHRHYAELEEGISSSFQDAAVHWYDTVYLPMVEVIHREKMLRLFPGRTEADLVAWIIRNQADLRRRYGHRQIKGEELAAEAAGRARQNLWQRLVSWFRRKLLRWPVYTGEPWRLD